MGTYPPPSLVSKWGTATDQSQRAGRLASAEDDLLDTVDTVVAELGTQAFPNGPRGAYATVADRLAALSSGQSGMKLSVRAATTYGPTYVLASSFENGDVLDGVTLATGDRILLWALADPTQNGIYTVNASGAPTRSADFTNGADMPGAAVYIREGNTNKGRTYVNANTTVPTVGTTAIAFAPLTARPTTIVVTPSNNSAHYEGDFACDGTADEFEINLAIFFLSLATVTRGEVHLAAGDFFLSGAIGLGGASVDLSGTGRAATIIHRTADVVALDLSGTGTLAHAPGPSRISSLQILGTTGGTNPAIRLYYCDKVVVEDVYLNAMSCVGIQMLEVWDTTFSRLCTTNVGTVGLGLKSGFGAGNVGTTGGRPAVLFVGDTATSGVGHSAPVGCNGLRFRDCVFDGSTDCAIQGHGNGAGGDFVGQVAVTHSDIVIDGCQFNATGGRAGWAPQVNLFRCNAVDVPYASVTQGDWFTGGSARNIIQFDTCNEVHIGRLACFGIETNTSVANWLRFTGPCANVSWDVLTIECVAAPTNAPVDISATSTSVRRGIVQHQSGPAFTNIVTGVPASEYRVFGTATIAVAATSIVVTHRLARTPVDGEVIVWAVTKPTTNDPGHIWVDTYTATQFTIHCAVAPTGTALVVAWRGQVDDNG